MKATTIGLLLAAGLIACAACSVMEQNIEVANDRPLPSLPTIANTTNSSTVFNAISAIQRSKERTLSAFVSYKNGIYVLEIPEWELKELGIQEEECLNYRKLVVSLNKH